MDYDTFGIYFVGLGVGRIVALKIGATMTRSHHFLPSYKKAVQPAETKGSSNKSTPTTVDTKTASSSAKKNSYVNSVVKGVSKLSLCGIKPPIEEYFFEVENDDGSHTTATASRSSGEFSSPIISPTRICQGRSPRHSWATPLPPITQAARRYSAESLTRWSEEQRRQFASRASSTNYDEDDESGILHHSDKEEDLPSSDRQKPSRGWDVDAYIGDVDAFMSDDDDDDDEEELGRRLAGYQNSGLPSDQSSNGEGYEDPPLYTQTNYAMEQLMKSTAYKDMHKKTMRTKKKYKQEYYQEDDFVDDEPFFVDEEDISRGLGGYEEGFGVPSMNSHGYHHLPHAIREEEDEISVASSIASLEPKRSNAHLEARRTSSNNEKRNAQPISDQESRALSACMHCRNGTCENPDCSESRFMI